MSDKVVGITVPALARTVSHDYFSDPPKLLSAQGIGPDRRPVLADVVPGKEAKEKHCEPLDEPVTRALLLEAATESGNEIVF